MIQGAIIVEYRGKPYYTTKSLANVLDWNVFDHLTNTLQTYAALDTISREVILPCERCDEVVASLEKNFYPPDEKILGRGRFVADGRQRYRRSDGASADIAIVKDQKTNRKYIVVFGGGIVPLESAVYSP